MKEHVTSLQYGEKEIILIATAHVLKESAHLVKKVIEDELPDSVCIELDHARYRGMQHPRPLGKQDFIKAIKSRRVGLLLTNLALNSYQKKLARLLDAPLGGDMLQGIESAKEVGATVIFADRPIQITFSRIWNKLNRWEKIKITFGLLFSLGKGTKISDQEVQKLLESDTLDTVLSDLHKKFPKVGDVLVTERDQYLATRIMTAPGEKIVAVLGGAHVPGVKREIERADLQGAPS